jgi:hypothetical protein
MIPAASRLRSSGAHRTSRGAQRPWPEVGAFYFGSGCHFNKYLVPLRFGGLGLDSFLGFWGWGTAGGLNGLSSHVLQLTSRKPTFEDLSDFDE